MLSLSQTTGYAILALSCLGSRDKWVLARQIAQRTRIPLPYLSKILHKLSVSGLIRAKRGYRGGFALARPAQRISLLEVAVAIDGPDCVSTCLLGLEDCNSEGLCPTRAFWSVERRRIRNKLRRTPLSRVSAFVARQEGNGEHRAICGCRQPCA